MNETRSILVIDDDPDIALYCTAVLEPQGYNVRSAPSAQEGEAALREQQPDLVILDIMMESPDSGLHLATTLAQDFPGLPVILFSSIADASAQIFDTSALPVAAFIEKPIRPEDLLEAVQGALGKKAS